MRELSRSLSATSQPVVQEVHPDERMIHGPADDYFGVGRSALRAVRLSLLAAGREAPQRVLDLPCGHGRVLRHLHAAFPQAELVACDLLEDGVKTCERQFGAAGVVAHEDPAQTSLPGRFDLIFCGSLVTHFPLPKWQSLGALLYEHCAPGGVLILTTMGRWAAERMRAGEHYGIDASCVPSLLQNFAAEGFGYADYPNTPGYGIALSRLSWVVANMEEMGMRVVHAAERGWDDHQDVVACQRL